MFLDFMSHLVFPNRTQCLTIWIQFHLLVNPLNAELNPICHLLALLGAHHILHVSGIGVEGWRHTHSANTNWNYSQSL
jgi:hypothetical protein